MEISFRAPGQMPLPPAETRVQSLQVAPWPDGRRVRVQVEITPFQQRPNLHIQIADAQGFEVASLVATQILQARMEFTLHLRQPETQGHYSVAAYLAYPELDLDGVGRAEAGFGNNVTRS